MAKLPICLCCWLMVLSSACRQQQQQNHRQRNARPTPSTQRCELPRDPPQIATAGRGSFKLKAQWFLSAEEYRTRSTKLTRQQVELARAFRVRSAPLARKEPSLDGPGDWLFSFHEYEQPWLSGVRMVYAAERAAMGHVLSRADWYFLYQGQLLFALTEEGDEVLAKNKLGVATKKRIKGLFLTTNRCVVDRWLALLCKEDRACPQRRSKQRTLLPIARPLLDALLRRARGEALRQETLAFARMLLMVFHETASCQLIEDDKEVSKRLDWHTSAPIHPLRIGREGDVITARGFVLLGHLANELVRFDLRATAKRLSMRHEHLGGFTVQVR